MRTITRFVLGGLLFLVNLGSPMAQNPPVRLGVAGLTHGHVGWILGREAGDDVRVVGIFEPNRELAEQYARRFGFSMDLVFGSLEEMLERTQPGAVTAFNAISEHLAVVEACAPRGVDVMVEKPLSTTLEDARRIAALSRRHGIQVVTNYETTWYPSTAEAFRRVHIDPQIGAVRKIVVHDGHEGPREIGVGPEFLSWLTDPVKNGGGASIDFGCYGANLITWLMKGQRPESVTAVFQQMKPEIYSKVDDEATIILTYPGVQGIIQASWNWPFGRKDLEVYGQTGYVHTVDARKMRIRLAGDSDEAEMEAPTNEGVFQEPFSYLAAVVRGTQEVSPTDLSSLEVNVTVVEILEAARESARQGRTIRLD